MSNFGLVFLSPSLRKIAHRKKSYIPLKIRIKSKEYPAPYSPSSFPKCVPGGLIQFGFFVLNLFSIPVMLVRTLFSKIYRTVQYYFTSLSYIHFFRSWYYSPRIIIIINSILARFFLLNLSRNKKNWSNQQSTYLHSKFYISCTANRNLIMVYNA